MTDSDKLFERFGREFPPGTVIFKEGDVGNEMYVIQSGKVNITKRARDQEKLLVTLGPGAFFGEMAIINNKPRSASAVVEESARLLVIGPKTFDAMIRGNAEIAVRMIKRLSAKIGLEVHQIEEVLNKLLAAKLIRKHDDGGLLIHDVTRLREFLEFLEMKEKFGDI
jgi:CRP/FNR family cyclic AMP-dependent transcriptional regulator